MGDMKQWRGLKNLLSDAVQRGATAIEQVHLATASRTFTVLEAIDPVAVPAQSAHKVHDAIVANGYEAVRAVTRAVDKAFDVALDAIEEGTPGSGSGSGSDAGSGSGSESGPR